MSQRDRDRYDEIRAHLARAQLDFGDNWRIQAAYELCNEGIDDHSELDPSESAEYADIYSDGVNRTL